VLGGNTMEKAFKMIREVKASVISTVENGVPQSRIIDIMGYDAGGVYFITCPSKPFYQQLMATKQVALTVMNEDYVQVRLVGQVEVIDSERVKKIFEDNPAMKDLFPDGESNFVPFYLSKGKGEIFDLSGREVKMRRERFAFGGETVNPAGCTITSTCIECDACKAVCPFNAIEVGSPYKIDPQYCDECGICYNTCPVQAIELPKGM